MNNSISTTTGKTKIKIVFIGNQAVGKSCIIQKYVRDRFDETSNPTVGIDFLVKNITVNNKAYRLQLWDTAGQQRFRSLIPNYLKDAKCALIIFDVTNRDSLNNVQSWLNLYNENKSGQGFTFLIGNKIDLQYRDVTQEEGRKKADELGLPYFQISAKTGENIEDLFTKLVEVTESKSITGVSFQLNKKPTEVIKEEQNAKEDDTEVKQESKITPQEQKKSPIQVQQTKIQDESKGVKLDSKPKSKMGNGGQKDSCC